MVRLDESHRCLLLLPRPPSEISINSLNVAYEPALIHVLQELAQISAESTKVFLDVAVAYHDLSSLDYASTQKFFGLMYRMACVISTEKSIDVQFGNDVDIRIMLFHSEKAGQFDTGASSPDRFIDLADLADLARTEKPWNHVYSVESENGEELVKEFLYLCKASPSEPGQNYATTRVPGGLTMNTNTHDDASKVRERDTSWSSHRSVAVGGTFDHLHAGHKLLLTMTALVLDPTKESNQLQDRCVTIGITGHELLKKKKYLEELEDWRERQGAVRAFLLDFLSFLSPKNVLKTSDDISRPDSPGREIREELQSGLHIKYKEIFDPFGPTITDSEIDALVISAETRAGGKAVNDKRAEKEWNLLEVFEVDVLDAEEGDEVSHKDHFEGKISSTEIRSRIRQKKESTSGNK